MTMTALARNIVSLDRIGVATPNDPSRNDKVKIANSNHLSHAHLKTSLSHVQHVGEGTQMSLSKSSKEFDLGARLAQALRRRIFQERLITVKQLAYALQASEQTIWNWLNGASEPKGTHLARLIFFFDESFANELFEGTGATVIKMSRVTRLAEAGQRLAEALHDIKKLGELE